MKKVKDFLIAILVLLLIAAVVLVGYFSNWFRAFIPSSPVEEEQKQETPKQSGSGVTDGEGNELTSGTTYAGLTAMIFSVPTAASETASEGITIFAVVTPENVIDKSVDYSVRFKDAESDWAHGKDPADYLEVVQKSDGSQEATVKCKAPFAEQLIITATSRTPNKDGEPVTDEIKVDYLQTVENVEVKIGDIDVNIGGDTSVTVRIGVGYGGAGGEITLSYTLSKVYTIAETYEANVSFTGGNPDDHPDGYLGEGDYVSMRGGGSMGLSYWYHYDDLEDAVGEEVYFDARIFTDYNFTYSRTYWNNSSLETEDKPFAEYFSDVEQLKEFFTSRAGKKLWDITVTFAGEQRTITYESALRWTGIDEFVPVQDVEIQQGGQKSEGLYF